jgi:CHAD domain-containing protein
MRQKRIADVIRRHYKNLTSISHVLSGKFAGEDVHAFRVEVKELRAMLKLAGSCRRGRGKPGRPGTVKLIMLPDRLHSFYGMTGIIRNLQLQRRSLSDFANKGPQELPASCGAVLDGRIATAISLAQLCLDQKQPFEKVDQLLEVLPERITAAAGRKFVRREMKSFLSLPDDHLSAANVNRAFARAADEERLHLFRKSLKDLLYAWPYLSKGAREEIRPMGFSSKKAVKLLAELLGDFRDTCLRLQLLQDNDFLFGSGPQSRDFLQAAGRSWIAEKELLLKKIIGCRISLRPCEQ